MPLVVPASRPRPPAPPPPATPVEQIGTIYATWTDPDGSVWDLSHPDPDHGWFTTNAIAGWGATPIELVTDPLARGGEQIRHIRALPRRLTWPLHIHGELDEHISHMRFVQRYRDLMHAFTKTSQRKKPGILRVARPDGSAREIEAWYEDGFGGQVGENWLWANPVLTLFCPDGYWRDTVAQSITHSHASGVPFLRPFMTVSSSRVLGEATIVNPGQVDAWPEWTITGPATQVIAVNNSADERFTLTYTLAAGETVTITTFQPTVRGPAGQNLVGSLDWPACQLWPLLPGINDIDFQVSGSGTGTAITLTFVPRYEAA